MIIVCQATCRQDRPETKLGEFPELIISLPRDNRSAAGDEPE
jgi:hypothetical protein